MSFRVVTFNIQNGEPFDESNPNCSDQDIIGTCQFLQQLDADLLILQEVERGFDGGMQVEPPPNYQILKNHFPNHDSVFSYPLKNDTEIPFGLGLVFFPVSKLFEYYSNGTMTDPKWGPKIIPRIPALGGTAKKPTKN